MCTEYNDEYKQHLIRKFNEDVRNYYQQVKTDCDDFTNNKDISEPQKCLKNKYPWLRDLRFTKRSDISKFKTTVKDLLNDDYFKNYKIPEKNIIYEYCIVKIRGLYKHAQALKTGFCNGQLITGFSEKNTLSICITKNTLEANAQWLIRLYKELDDRYPNSKLDDKIMLISSKKNDLDGNATHCKNMEKAWSFLKKENNFKLIFICSNKVRIQNVLEIAESFLGLRENLRKNLRIFHDEAHNTKEGIPPYRNIIENFIFLENVLSYQPISASPGEIVDNNNPLWQKENLDNYAVNFTEFDNTKSDNPNYSSISDYEKISIDELQKKDEWQDYGINEISRENFIKVDGKYSDKHIDDLSDVEIEDLKKQLDKLIDKKNNPNKQAKETDIDELDQEIKQMEIKNSEIEDIDRRRQLEFCQFMANDREITALNNGLNLLNLNIILQKQHYSKSEFNLHIICTPRRNIISYELSMRACMMEYNPIVLGIYGNQGSKYHLFINGRAEMIVDNEMGDGEFNTKLYNLKKYLEGTGINTNCCWIIIGNYSPTGESLSFVNYHYGTVKCVSRLTSTNAEEDYQAAARGNFMVTKFKENDSEWTPPPKYLIGEEAYINNALSYERENDARIDSFAEQSSDTITSNVILPENNSGAQTRIKSNNTSIPVKIKMDTNSNNNPYYKELIDIASQPRRGEEDKNRFIVLLQLCIEDDVIDCDIEDQTGKLDFKNIKPNGFRCFTNEREKKKGYWKFQSYKTNFAAKQPFINSTSEHSTGQCELLVCKDMYLLRDEHNKIIERNPPSIWWLSYKY
tara:strand:- start:4658 stop:7060 length:2403 start_codon:yes stop_codon:yes gene_type:complete